MLFNSLEFAVFLAVVLPLYHLLDSRRQNALLLIASYVFYGWWDWRFLALLGASTLLDYRFAHAIARRSDARTRRRLLSLSLGISLGMLGVFKYYDFFVEGGAELLRALGFQTHPTLLRVVLPVGISFYTFQTMAYVIDVYRGVQPPVQRLASFALYIAYFPQLMAGPIERARALLPQLEAPRQITVEDWSIGLRLLALGFFKKLCIADAVAPAVDRAFASTGTLGGPEALLAVYLFTLQIYGDFSGYTDIARGVSRLLGIRLSLNFRQPYLSTDIGEFWRRWHISLSSWLRDYLYIPLGGSRAGSLRTYGNLIVTMLLGGLWHGASWTFVVWGALHGVALGLQRARRGAAKAPASAERAPRHALRVLVTFHVVALLWTLFRSPDLATAGAMLGALFHGGSLPTLARAAAAAMLLGVVLALELLARNDPEGLPALESWHPWQRGVVYGALLGALSWIGEPNVRPFIYFQF